jgi:hypothetical protein
VGGWGAMALETMRASYYIIMNIIDIFWKLIWNYQKQSNDGHTSLWENEGIDHHIQMIGKSKKGESRWSMYKAETSRASGGVEYSIWPKGRHDFAHTIHFKVYGGCVLLADLFEFDLNLLGTVEPSQVIFQYVEFSRNYLFEIFKLKEITIFVGKLMSFFFFFLVLFCFRPMHHQKLLNNWQQNFPFNLVKHAWSISPFLQK